MVAHVQMIAASKLEMLLAKHSNCPNIAVRLPTMLWMILCVNTVAHPWLLRPQAEVEALRRGDDEVLLAAATERPSEHAAPAAPTTVEEASSKQPAAPQPVEQEVVLPVPAVQVTPPQGRSVSLREPPRHFSSSTGFVRSATEKVGAKPAIRSKEEVKSIMNDAFIFVCNLNVRSVIVVISLFPRLTLQRLCSCPWSANCMFCHVSPRLRPS